MCVACQRGNYILTESQCWHECGRRHSKGISHGASSTIFGKAIAALRMNPNKRRIRRAKQKKKPASRARALSPIESCSSSSSGPFCVSACFGLIRWHYKDIVLHYYLQWQWHQANEREKKKKHWPWLSSQTKWLPYHQQREHSCAHLLYVFLYYFFSVLCYCCCSWCARMVADNSTFSRICHHYSHVDNDACFPAQCRICFVFYVSITRLHEKK